MRIGTLSDIRKPQTRRPPFVAPGLVLGPELLANWDFSSGATGWTVGGADATHIATFSGGTCRYQSDTTSPVLNVGQPILTVGKRYQVQVVCSAYGSGLTKTDSFSVGNQPIATALGTRTFEATAISSSFTFLRNGTNVDVTIDSISIREILN